MRRKGQMFVSIAALLAVCVFGQSAQASWWPSSWSWSPSWSGSWSGSHQAEDRVQKVREVEVGPHTVELPDNGAELLRLDESKVVFRYAGNQVISTEATDVMSAMGVVLPIEGETGDWTYTYGIAGGVLVYQAKHKGVPNLYVHGSVKDSKALQAILSQVSLKKVEVKPQQPTK